MNYAHSHQSRNDRNRQQLPDARAQRAQRHARNERLMEARELDREAERESLRFEVSSFNSDEDR